MPLLLAALTCSTLSNGGKYYDVKDYPVRVYYGK